MCLEGLLWVLWTVVADNLLNFHLSRTRLQTERHRVPGETDQATVVVSWDTQCSRFDWIAIHVVCQGHIIPHRGKRACNTVKREKFKCVLACTVPARTCTPSNMLVPPTPFRSPWKAKHSIFCFHVWILPYSTGLCKLQTLFIYTTFECPL